MGQSHHPRPVPGQSPAPPPHRPRRPRSWVVCGWRWSEGFAGTRSQPHTWVSGQVETSARGWGGGWGLERGSGQGRAAVRVLCVSQSSRQGPGNLRGSQSSV